MTPRDCCCAGPVPARHRGCADGLRFAKRVKGTLQLSAESVFATKVRCNAKIRSALRTRRSFSRLKGLSGVVGAGIEASRQVAGASACH